LYPQSTINKQQNSAIMSDKPELLKKSIVLKYYNRYEHLATHYAKQIFEAGKIGYEFDDLVQEFRIKIYTSIIAYAAKWRKYQVLKRYKPIPIEYYIKSALVNRSKDFIRLINEAEYINISVEQDGFDYGKIQSIESHIVINKDVCQCNINGVDLLEGLTDWEARCFMMFLRGFTIGKLSKIFKPKFIASEVINRQIQFLQPKRAQLLENQVQSFTHYLSNSDNNYN
jgi:hypothetical protein